MIVEPFDMTSITRPGSTSTLEIWDDVVGRLQLWLTFGVCDLWRPSKHPSEPEQWTLRAYLRDETDEEHDPAIAFSLPLVAVSFVSVHASRCAVLAVIAPRAARDFRVPLPGYDPAKLPDVDTCPRCKPPHVIVPEGYYLPPHMPELYAAVSGLSVRINIGPSKDAP